MTSKLMNEIASLPVPLAALAVAALMALLGWMVLHSAARLRAERRLERELAELARGDLKLLREMDSVIKGLLASPDDLKLSREALEILLRSVRRLKEPEQRIAREALSQPTPIGRARYAARILKRGRDEVAL